MSHTQSIINLACIVRKHESGRVIKVLLVPPLPGSSTDRALVCVAARLLASCLYVQSGFLMKSVGRQEVDELKDVGGRGVAFDSDEGSLFSRTGAIL